MTKPDANCKRCGSPNPQNVVSCSEDLDGSYCGPCLDRLSNQYEVYDANVIYDEWNVNRVVLGPAISEDSD